MTTASVPDTIIVEPSISDTSALRRFFAGPAEDPRWVRPALWALLLGTGVLYIWGLGASGWANSFYSAAVQAGSASWTALFFGSSDAANSITVDKPPVSLWIMAVSARIFGVNAWSILVPQALEGVAAVGLLYATVRRRFSPGAALLAGAVLALTPVAVLMFRFNNPDALLVLLMVGAAYATLRAAEKASAKWIMLAGVLIGFGFLTKMLQVFLVLPALALVYLVAAPTGLLRRVGHLLLGGLAIVVSAGWWIAAVELIPAEYRPYVGGSQNNSILELTLGYNGLGRITGDEVGSVGGGRTGGWGEVGILRMVNPEMGGQVAWLLPAALVMLVVGIWVTARAPRTDLRRAAYLGWGGWLVVTTLVFSFMQGIFHAYYTVALAPAIAALIGMGATDLWSRRRHPLAIAVLTISVAGTSVWSYVLLGRSPDFLPWLRFAVLGAGLVFSVGMILVRWLPGRAAIVVAAVALVATVAGPAAYAVNTAATPHQGSIPSAGPAVAGSVTGGPRVFREQPPGVQGRPVQPPAGFVLGEQSPMRGPAGGNSGAGGLLNGSTPGEEMVALLESDADSYTWVAAAIGSNSASGFQLATGNPVMAIGGFNGSDPSPTLVQFQEYVSRGEIHYFIGGGNMLRANGGSDNGQLISAWVSENFTATTVDGVMVYDLTAPKSR